MVVEIEDVDVDEDEGTMAAENRLRDAGVAEPS
jgi:hypothetical protein